jgi:5-methyltetrahydrofolate--homocysteine methyltransferase
MADMKILAQRLIEGKADEVRKLTEAALKEGVPPSEILNKGLIAGMDVVGDRFRKNEIFVPEVLIAARAMKAGMEVLRPALVASGVRARGKIVMGTVKGDLHDIGKNLVSMMLEGAGFEVIDLGISVPAERFVEAAEENMADMVGMSALLTTTMLHMREVVEKLRDRTGGRVKAIVGGAPVSQSYADEIGADGYAPDATSAVELVKSILQANTA